MSLDPLDRIIQTQTSVVIQYAIVDGMLNKHSRNLGSNSCLGVGHGNGEPGFEHLIYLKNLIRISISQKQFDGTEQPPPPQHMLIFFFLYAFLAQEEKRWIYCSLRR